MTGREALISDLFGRLLERSGRVYPGELDRLLADAGEPPATREELDRAAGLATDPVDKARQAEALRELVHACDAAGLRPEDQVGTVLERLGLVRRAKR